MNDSEFRERVKRLEEVNGVITRLDQAIRADAFALLKPYVTGVQDVQGGEDDDDEEHSSRGIEERSQIGDEDALVEKFESSKEYENALLALAILYMRHGKGPFSLGVIRAIAQEFGLDIPDRIDVTFSGMKRDDSKVLRKQGTGDWKITPGGGTWLEETYKVKKGKRPLPDGQ